MDVSNFGKRVPWTTTRTKATKREIREARCEAVSRHPERATAEASHDADPAVGAGPGENEPKGARQPGQPEDGGAGIVRADAGRRAAGRSRAYTGTKETTHESASSRADDARHQVPVRFRERLLPKNRVSGSAGSVSHSVRRGDQAGPHLRFHGAAADSQTEPDAGPEEPISDHHRRGAPAKHGDRQMSPRGRSGSQPGPVARHEVGLRQGVASLLQSVRPIRAV